MGVYMGDLKHLRDQTCSSIVLELCRSTDTRSISTERGSVSNYALFEGERLCHSRVRFMIVIGYIGFLHLDSVDLLA